MHRSGKSFFLLLRLACNTKRMCWCILTAFLKWGGVFWWTAGNWNHFFTILLFRLSYYCNTLLTRYYSMSNKYSPPSVPYYRRIGKISLRCLAYFHFCGPTQLLAVYGVMLQCPLCWTECKSAMKTSSYNRKWHFNIWPPKGPLSTKGLRLCPQKKIVISNVDVLQIGHNIIVRQSTLS